MQISTRHAIISQNGRLCAAQVQKKTHPHLIQKWSKDEEKNKMTMAKGAKFHFLLIPCLEICLLTSNQIKLLAGNGNVNRDRLLSIGNCANDQGLFCTVSQFCTVSMT